MMSRRRPEANGSAAAPRKHARTCCRQRSATAHKVECVEAHEGRTIPQGTAQRCPVAKKKRAHASQHGQDHRRLRAAPLLARRTCTTTGTPAPRARTALPRCGASKQEQQKRSTMSAPKDALPTPLTPARRSTPAHASTTSGAARARRGNAVRSIACTAAAVPSFAPAAESQDASAPLAFRRAHPDCQRETQSHNVEPVVLMRAALRVPWAGCPSRAQAPGRRTDRAPRRTNTSTPARH